VIKCELKSIQSSASYESRVHLKRVCYVSQSLLPAFFQFLQMQRKSIAIYLHAVYALLLNLPHMLLKHLFEQVSPHPVSYQIKNPLEETVPKAAVLSLRAAQM